MNHENNRSHRPVTDLLNTRSRVLAVPAGLCQRRQSNVGLSAAPEPTPPHPTFPPQGGEGKRGPVHAVLARVPLGPCPWLHGLRRQLPGTVRPLHSYYGRIRLLPVVHHRLRLIAFPMRAGTAIAAGQRRDLPVPVQGASVHARVSDHAEPTLVLALTHAIVWPSAGQTASALRSKAFAAQWLAYTIPYRRFAPDLTVRNARLGADVVRCSFIVVDSHHLLLAGLPAHQTPFPLRDIRAGCQDMRSSRRW
jgi:hypothetical protein